jgi:LuxR family maltose regulon positive regulatory protein
MNQSTPHLTEREKQILRLVKQGLTNKEIAQSLGITSRTVEFHLGNFFKKLEVSNRTAAVMATVKIGILED